MPTVKSNDLISTEPNGGKHFQKYAKFHTNFVIISAAATTTSQGGGVLFDLLLPHLCSCVFKKAFNLLKPSGYFTYQQV
jgi:hypothetical protein